jgi:uncharacterized glyoxalase superfamily protein PhnB
VGPFPDQSNLIFSTTAKRCAIAFLMRAHFILYVKNQQSSTKFYSTVLNAEPTLNVPGMTEFTLNSETILGIMPESGIVRLLGSSLPDPTRGNGIPRAEIYLKVNGPQIYHERALLEGAKELSKLSERDWGDRVAYSIDSDGHVLAFAESIK